MSTPYISQIEAFAFGYAPRGWVACAGQLLPINQYQALFSLVGTTYGGNGTTNFQLPDLRSRVAIGQGTGPGLPTYLPGNTVGEENHTVTMSDMPAGPHTHTVSAFNNGTTGGTNIGGTTVQLSSAYTTATPAVPIDIYSTDAPTIAMGTLSATGGSPHTNLMPYNVLTYYICTSGLFPSRN